MFTNGVRIFGKVIAILCLLDAAALNVIYWFTNEVPAHDAVKGSFVLIALALGIFFCWFGFTMRPLPKPSKF